VQYIQRISTPSQWDGSQGPRLSPTPEGLWLVPTRSFLLNFLHLLRLLRLLQATRAKEQTFAELADDNKTVRPAGTQEQPHKDQENSEAILYRSSLVLLPWLRERKMSEEVACRTYLSYLCSV